MRNGDRLVGWELGRSAEKTAVWKEMQSAREHSCCEFGRVETSPKGTFRGAVYQSAQEP